MRCLAVVVMMHALTASAEAPWGATRGRVVSQRHLEILVGTRGVGLGYWRPVVDGRRASVGAELGYSWADRTVDLRAARVWQLGASRVATPSVHLGGSLTVVPLSSFDVGLGPHGGVTLALGGEVFSVDMALQAGAELYFGGDRAPAIPELRMPLLRFPVRGALGVNVQVLSIMTVGLHARAGVDVIVGHAFVGRGELLMSLGWLTTAH